MNHAVLPDNVTIRPAELDVDTIIVRERQRQVSADHVALLRGSIREMGKQIVPIAVSERSDGTLILIDGAHRLEAAKQDGRQFIRAEVYSNLAEDQENVLEFVTNRARKDLSPAEILVAWETFDLPLHSLRAKEKQSEAANFARDYVGDPTKSLLIDGINKQTDRPQVSLETFALETTGHAPSWLNKIASIRDLAENKEAPAVVREVAQRGFEKLKNPNAKVDPIMKEVQKVHEAVLRQAEDPEILLARDAEDRLDQMVKHTTLLQEKLEGDLRDFLAFAGRRDQMGRDMLRAVRVALVRSLTSVVVIECELDGDVSVNLSTIGAEVTKLLSQESMKSLGLKPAAGEAQHA